MAYLLHIETSTNICSVSISQNDSLLVNKESTESYSHAKSITLLIDACLKEANISVKQLDAVSVSKGPGSYTALRVGASTAKGICYAMNIPLIAVDTLHSLALASKIEDDKDVIYCAMIDARRMEVYASIYNHKMEILDKTDAVIIDGNSFDKYYAEGYKIILSGDGAEKCFPVLNKNTKDSNILCSASHLISLAFEAFKNERFVDTAYFEPTYFKPPNITTPKKVL